MQELYRAWSRPSVRTSSRSRREQDARLGELEALPARCLFEHAARARTAQPEYGGHRDLPVASVASTGDVLPRLDDQGHAPMAPAQHMDVDTVRAR